MSVVGRTDRHFRTIEFIAPLLLMFIGLILAWFSASGLKLDTYHYQVQASGEPAPLFSLFLSPTGMTIDSGSDLI